jgi:hypothetical protein
MGRLAFNMFRIVRYRRIGMDWLVLLLTFNVRVGLSGMGPSVLLCRTVPRGSISVAVNVCLFLCYASRSIPGTALIACQREQPPPASKLSSTTAPPVSLLTAPPDECGHRSTTSASATAPHSGTDWGVSLVQLVRSTLEVVAAVLMDILWLKPCAIAYRRCIVHMWAMLVGTAVTVSAMQASMLSVLVVYVRDSSPTINAILVMPSPTLFIAMVSASARQVSI